MKVSIEGVTIELTKTQISYIEKEKAKRLKECNSFQSVLKKFGLKKINTKGWEDPSKNCWQHKDGLKFSN